MRGVSISNFRSQISAENCQDRLSITTPIVQINDCMHVRKHNNASIYLCVLDDMKCTAKSCQNGGQCQEAVNTIVCVCPAGVAGERCSNRSMSRSDVEEST